MTRKAITIALLILLAGAAGLVVWLRSRAAIPPRAEVPASGRKVGPPDTAAIPALLRDTSWQRRAATAWGLAEFPQMPPRRRAALLLDVLQSEVTSPTHAPQITGSYLPLTSFLRIHYLHVLETLGPEARDPVSDAHRGSRGEVREWYTLALGATRAPEGAAELRELLARSRDPAVRMTAARYLGWLKDRTAEPILKAALSDTATAEVVTDVAGRPPRRFFPVREQAAGALQAIGFKVTLEDGTYTVQ